MKNTLRSFIFIISFFCSLKSFTQDTVHVVQLDSVIVRSYGRETRLRDVPAPLGFINRTNLQRFGTASVTDAINTIPGVRMEERSPGSYRFNIRGSALRAPFGVRNVKVYYNDLPFTDPSGQTYLNALGNYDYGSVEVLRGPGNSYYGAGTGGVLLIDAIKPNPDERFFVEHTIGSYGLQNSYAALSLNNNASASRIAFQHQQSDGYRNQSALERNILNWTSQFQLSNESQLKTTFLYSDLYYETPGGLNANEYAANRKAARPAAGAFPSAEAINAHIRQRTLLTGASYNHTLAEGLQWQAVAYSSFMKLDNPAIRNYGKNLELHFGGRTSLNWRKVFQNTILAARIGAEWQQGFADLSTYTNAGGASDSLRSQNEAQTRQGFLFSHVQLQTADWTFEAGASYNEYKIRQQVFFPDPLPKATRKFNNEVAPRFAVMRSFNAVNLYSSISKGFSSPTIAEAMPTGSAVNLDLNAERGANTDFGLKGNFFKTLYFDANVFYYRLKNTIVLRRDAGGGDYYINAGKTKQWGAEFSARQSFNVANALKPVLWANYAWHQFKYDDFKQLENDFSGNRLPGVPEHTVSAGFDVAWQHFFAAINHYYASRTSLNDANNAYLDAYHLTNLRIAYNFQLAPKWRTALAFGANNIFDADYSTGPDINAAAGRYYNAAPGRNYYVSLSLGLHQNQ